MVKTGKEAVEKALTYKSFAYWYGGKGQKCTDALLAGLSKSYSSIYTSTYRKKCREDIKKGKSCIDCSGLVCKAYGIADIGTYQIASDSRFLTWDGTPKEGMILWKWTHCGIYHDGYVIEARGKDYGVTATRKYKSADWMRVYYMKGVSYKTDKTPTEILQAAIDTIAGRYSVGNARIIALEKAGFDPDQIQKLVNTAIGGAS